METSRPKGSRCRVPPVKYLNLGESGAAAGPGVSTVGGRGGGLTALLEGAAHADGSVTDYSRSRSRSRSPAALSPPRASSSSALSSDSESWDGEGEVGSTREPLRDPGQSKQRQDAPPPAQAEDDNEDVGLGPTPAPKTATTIAVSGGASPPVDTDEVIMVPKTLEKELASALRKKLDREYCKWPLKHLRSACQKRRIKGQSKATDKDAVACLLAEADRENGRESPYFDDLVTYGREGNKDSHCINEVVGKQPGRMEFIDKLMPEHARMEDAGIGGACPGGSSYDASARRAEGKRKAKEERAAVGRITKRTSRDRDIQQTTDMAVKGAMGLLWTMLGSIIGPEKSKTQDDREGFEKNRARLDLKDAMYKSYMNCRRSLEDEEARGDRASAIFVKTLKRDVQQFEEAMAKDLVDGV